MVKSSSVVSRVLAIAITVLAVADGVLHLSLDAILFRGNFFGRVGPPPGAPQGPPPPGFPPPPPIPAPLPLNQMFVLNFVGYAVLVALFWIAVRRTGAWRQWVDVAFVVYVALVFGAWVNFGMPNPMGLGYLSKAIEVALLIVLVADAAREFARPRAPVLSTTTM